MKQLFREPLVHFIALGFFIFVANYLWSGGRDEDERRIVVSESVLARLDETWLRTTGSPPSAEDRKGLIDQYVQDEALVREAKALGLDEGDEIIKRRLAQKMRYVAGVEEANVDPSDSEVENWFNDNQDRFNIAERRTFNHIYFSPEKHGANIEVAAKNALKKLHSGTEWKSLGDPFMQKRSYAVLPQGEVTRAFGPDFAKAIFTLPKGRWSEPIGSAFGLHLVNIENIDKAAKADFAANRDRIRAAYIDAQAETGRQKEIDRIVARYKVIVAGAD